MTTKTILNVAGLESRTTNRFRWELVKGAEKNGFNAGYLAAVMRLESNFDPNIQNQQGAPAMGLIQFWHSFFPSVAKAAGKPSTTWEDLRTMSAVEQLPFVFAAFRGKRLGPNSTPTDYYMANFLPAFVGKPESFVLGEKGSSELLQGTSLSKGKIYDQNFGLDANGDGIITVGDVGSKINSVVNAARARPPLEVTEEAGPLDSEPPPSSGFPPSLSSLLPSGGRVNAERELSMGSRGELVGVWQAYLNSQRGTKLVVDGIFGPITQAATIKHTDSTRVGELHWQAVRRVMASAPSIIPK